MLLDVILMVTCSNASARYREAGLKKGVSLKVFLIWLATAVACFALAFFDDAPPGTPFMHSLMVVVFIIGYTVMFSIALTARADSKCSSKNNLNSLAFVPAIFAGSRPAKSTHENRQVFKLFLDDCLVHHAAGLWNIPVIHRPAA